MADSPYKQAVKDSIVKINDEVAVGEDLDFQERWWKFERIVWGFFTVVLLCTFAGLLGRGPMAVGHMQNEYMRVQYEHIARSGTPNMMEIKFTQAAIHDGRVQLYVSDSVPKELGSTRVTPSPLETSMGSDGLTYTFAASVVPAAVKFSLQPDGPGIVPLTVGIAGQPALHTKVIVLP